jgi:uncharacterized protein (DUF58 family)
MFGLATLTQSIWIQVVGAGLVGLLVVSFGVLLRSRPFTVDVSYGDELVVGHPLTATVQVRNTGSRSSRPLRITVSAERLLVPFGIYVDPVAADSTVELRARYTLAVRGWAPALRADVEVMAPFGFFVHSRPMSFERPLVVAPPTVAPLDLPAVAGGQADGAGALGPGLDVRGVRQWRPGDTARHVHWRSTARTGRLTVLDYGEPMVGCVGVLVAGTVGEPRFEAALAVAASTARQAMTQGVEVVVAGVGTGPHAPVGSGIETLTLANWHRVFALVGNVGRTGEIDELIEVIGHGGLLLMAVGVGVPGAWPDYVEATAARVGVRVLDCGSGLRS